MASIYIARGNSCYQLFGSDADKVKAVYEKDMKYGAKKGTCKYHDFDHESKTKRTWHGFTITRWTKDKSSAEEGDIELWSDSSIVKGNYCMQV